jgi:tRNA threonylcarbamoyladenosine biosynthesis protein TsaB
LQITNHQLQMSQLLLAIDTSGKNGSLALARLTPGQSESEIGVTEISVSEISVLEVVPLAGGAFSAQLVPQIAALLKKHGYGKSDLGAFAVASGPGSFTGLRVGLAAVKALAEALQKPIVAISLLEAVARSGAARGRVLAALDAGRGDVYVGDYELDPQVRMPCRMHSERLLSREEFLADARGKAVVTPEAGLAATVRAAGSAAGIRFELIEYPNSGAIARLGWEHLQRGQTVRPEELEANYIRHSDAEIFSKPAP